MREEGEGTSGRSRKKRSDLHFLILREATQEEIEHLLETSTVRVVCLGGRRGSEGDSKDRRRTWGYRAQQMVGGQGGCA